MTELERRALLGDKQAQYKCTKNGIVLPCPFCGGAAMIEYDTVSPFEYNVFCGDCGVMLGISEDKRVAISEWNTRPAPPIGRCGECEFHDTFDCPTSKTGYTEKAMKYCSWFEPKGGNHDAES